MDLTYSCLLIFVFVAVILTVLFRCKLKCGSCPDSENYMDFLPTEGSLPTGEGGYLLEGDSLAQYDYVNNIYCLMCRRDYSPNMDRVCAPYCIPGYGI